LFYDVISLLQFAKIYEILDSYSSVGEDSSLLENGAASQNATSDETQNTYN